MTLRSYAIAVTVLAIIGACVFVGGGWVVGGSGEHVFGQDTEQ